MQFSGEHAIPAPRSRVWEALNTVEILRVCIDGCRRLEWTGNDTLAIEVVARIGPIKAVFEGSLWLTDVEPELSYTLNGQGEGVGAGFVRGQAKVSLEDLEDGRCRITYDCDTNIGGVLANLGRALVTGVAERTTGQFFDRFMHRLIVAMVAVDHGRALTSLHSEDLGQPVLPSEGRGAEKILSNIDSMLAGTSSSGSAVSAPASNGAGRTSPEPPDLTEDTSAAVSLASPRFWVIGGGLILFVLFAGLMIFGG